MNKSLTLQPFKEVPMSNRIRPIVRAAFKCDALVYQFTEIDVEDGLIEATDYDGIVAEVNERYVDDAIVREAENRLDICDDPYNQLDPDYIREAKQLRAFIKRWRG
jgi:hypothetical protein